MRKKFLTIILTIVFCLCLFTACKGCFADEHKFLYEKMNEIPVEYEGYYLEKCGGSSDENVFTGKDHAEYVFRNKPLIVSEKNTMLNNAPFVCYTVVYDEKEILIDAEFMEKRSAVYDRINHIWDGKLNENFKSKTSELAGVAVYDEKIFIITCGLDTGLAGTVKGESPYVLYFYDIDEDKILYCNFYAGELNDVGGYSGFLAWQYLTIKNREKTK
ncbi:MAG: hypothetical protein SOX77_02220 [Candidatus Borkfalkiaceae bacterium]|nr:hypothetical protein [Christensenellaceae bacterium]